MKKIKKPVPMDAVKYIQIKGININDDFRLLIALLNDKGMRSVEGVGLLRSVIIFDTEATRLNLTLPHSADHAINSGTRPTL